MSAIVVKCPRCQTDIAVSFIKKNNDYTVEQTVLLSKKATAFSGYLLCNGKCYALSYGESLVGRKGSLPIDIALETNDRYMSRQHAYIKVLHLPDGSVITTIRPARMKIIVNGILLEGDDEITLVDKSEILMGKTIVLFRSDVDRLL